MFEPLYSIRDVDVIHRDKNEWDMPRVRGSSILILSYGAWNILVIAPLLTGSMAKITAGLANSLLLCVLRAWNTTGEIQGSRGKRIVLSNQPNDVEASRYEKGDSGAGRSLGPLMESTVDGSSC